MIKKIRIKFVLFIMIITLVLLCVMLSFIYISTRHSLEKESNEALNWYLSKEPSLVFSDRFGRLFASKQKYSQYNVFIFDYVPDSHSITPYGLGDDLDEYETLYINHLMDEVLENDLYGGILEDHQLKYSADNIHSGIRIAFLDMRYQTETLRNLLWRLILIGIISLVIVFFIAIFVAKKTFLPLEKSWNQQKQLISDVSHELKTPIAVISANTSIIVSHTDSTVENELKRLNYIKDETNKMNELITSLLYLAKSDEMQSKIEKEKIDLSSVIMSAVLPFESICFEKGLSLEYDISPDIYFNGNKELFARLVSILTDNACKYASPATSIKVALYTSGDKIFLSVNNKGDLISPEDLKHLFERFYRSDPSRQSNGSSFGLGLSIAKTIVESHDGKINAYSDAESGNTFVCVFKKL